ncbi:hypothetical protein [Crocosphaera sp.]|uniref:hypothetical protein n=1 Tax=Crocosphaera sp. TaxID=2729996 RepID=UPI002607EC3B|nr:hypothetical protein [Crocosphaera sp.]MDJ0580045.1 hypothetical protein [Crocosphaera sp.]
MDNNFFRSWNVRYIDEPQFSGTMRISRSDGNTNVRGNILRDGVPDGSYVSTSASFPSNSRLEFNFRLATGDTGKVQLDLREIQVGGIVTAVSASGRYQDDGGGDTGRIELSPIFPNAANIGDNFTYSPSIIASHQATLEERHRFAYGQINVCGNLSNQQKEALRIAYTRQIDHDINTTPGVNASAFVGGNQIFVNFDVLFPQGDQEIAQTLIHEMMHCAGYTHPVRMAGDTPGDGGPYYSTPPLQSEICIAGVQSDKACEMIDGQCTIK